MFWKNDDVDHDLIQYIQTLRPHITTALLVMPGRILETFYLLTIK